MTIGQRLLKTARKALEDLAAEEFSEKRLLEACQAAAGKGYLSCQVRPSIPVDVSETQHLKDVRAILQKQWIESSWIPYGLPGETPYKILELRWEGRT